MLLTLWLAKRRDISPLLYNTLLDELQQIPGKIEQILKTFSDPYRDNSINHIKNATSMFYLWRGWEYPIACEWSLKMKEISYIHSEAYPAGELKHGPLALIQNTVPSVIIAVDDEFLQQNLSSIAEIQARKWTIVALAHEPLPNVEHTLIIPRTHSLLIPFLTSVTMQLLSYKTAHALQREIDKPRNLAKSVTVK